MICKICRGIVILTFLAFTASAFSLTDAGELIQLTGHVTDSNTRHTIEGACLRFQFFNFEFEMNEVLYDIFSDGLGNFAVNFDRQQLNRTIHYTVSKKGYETITDSLRLYVGKRLEICLRPETAVGNMVEVEPQIVNEPIKISGSIFDLDDGSVIDGVGLRYQLEDSSRSKVFVEIKTDKSGKFQYEFDGRYRNKTLDFEASKVGYVTTKDTVTFRGASYFNLGLRQESSRKWKEPMAYTAAGVSACIIVKWIINSLKK